MTYPHTGSQILTEKGQNQTRTGLSTHIIIMVDGNTVGAVQDLSYDENREIAQIDEIGTDGHIDSVPRRSTSISGSCKRIKFDGLSLPQALSRNFVHLHSARIPFDFVLLDVFAAEENDDGSFSNEDKIITTVIKNVWLKSIRTSFSSQDFVVTQDVNWEAEAIYSYIGQGLPIAGNVSEARPIPLLNDDAIQKQADIGKRRGALDAAGLINVIDNFVL